MLCPSVHNWHPYTYTIPAGVAANPASVTLDGYFMYRLQAIYYDLDTDATVANRFPRVALTDLTPNQFLLQYATAITASKTTGIHLFNGLGATENYQSDIYCAGLPTDFILIGQSTIYVTADVLQAGDQITGGRVYVQRRAIVPPT